MLSEEQLKAATATELEEARFAIIQEQIRRQEVENIPVNVEAQIQRYVDSGGDPSKIRNPNSFIKGPKFTTPGPTTPEGVPINGPSKPVRPSDTK